MLVVDLVNCLLHWTFPLSDKFAVSMTDQIIYKDKASLIDSLNHTNVLKLIVL